MTGEPNYRPGAGHGFHAGYRPSCWPDAAKDAWARCVARFDKDFKP